MARKKKAKLPQQDSCKRGSSSQVSSFLDEVIQNLPQLREAGGLTVGFNATVRKIEKGNISLALFISRQGTSAMYHALNSMCKTRDVLLLSLNDISIVLSSSKLPSSSVYGFQASVLEKPQFSSLLGKINQAKVSHRNSKNKKVEDPQPEAEDGMEQTEEESEIPCQAENVTHPKHRTISPVTYRGGGESFLCLSEVDFPDYKCKSSWTVSVDAKRSKKSFTLET